MSWAVVAVLGVGTILRVVAWDDVAPSVIFNAFIPVVYVPLWLVAPGALVSRRWVLAGVSLALVVAQVLLAAPEIRARRPVPLTAGAPVLHLLDANVRDTNPSMAGYARQIRALRPDLVTLEEATPGDGLQLIDDGALSGLRYATQLGDGGGYNFALASRYPLSPAVIVRAPGLDEPLAVTTALTLPSGRRLTLWVIHTLSPRPQRTAQWSAQLRFLASRLRRVGGPLLVVGDFNATWNSRSFRRILATGLTDGAAARGHPWSWTWSQDVSPLPPLVRIDHVLTRDGPVVTAISTAPGPGSDHRELRATIAVP